jgi:hypothetical protein
LLIWKSVRGALSVIFAVAIFRTQLAGLASRLMLVCTLGTGREKVRRGILLNSVLQRRRRHGVASLLSYGRRGRRSGNLLKAEQYRDY